jgi:hypothetical protein
MQPVSPYRARYANTDDEDSSSPAQANARSAPPPPPDPAELPDLRDHSLSLTTTQLMPKASVDSLTTRVRDQAMQRSLDAFMKSATPEFRTPDGPAAVPITFQMSSHYSNQPDLEMAKNDPRMKRAMNDAHLTDTRLNAVLQGRGTPADIRALTQALIDRNGLRQEQNSTVAERVRKVMFDHHIGIDCAGYTQLAYLAATGLTRSQAGFRDDENEDLSRLPSNPAYRKIAPENVRPGDIGVLGPPPNQQVGHRVVVYSQHFASSEEMEQLRSINPGGADFGKRQPIRVFEVDSSWGCTTGGDVVAGRPAGNPQSGGVIRCRWWYSESTKEWAHWEGGLQVSANGPYGHPLIGFYRRRDSNSLALPALKGQS